MSQGRTVVEPRDNATTVMIDVDTDLTIKLGTTDEVKAQSVKPIAITRARTRPRLIVSDDVSIGGAVASGAGSVAVGGNNTGIISTGVGSRIAGPTGMPVIDTSEPVRGTVVTVPEGVEVVVEFAKSIAADPTVEGKIRVIDNR
jgi:hypothetical protein